MTFQQLIRMFVVQTIKAQLEKHRSSATCNECHRKIDPLGFAMECFDPIGRTRTTYDVRGKLKVDTEGILPGGEAFSDLAELKKILVSHEEFFVRTLVSTSPHPCYRTTY